MRNENEIGRQILKHMPAGVLAKIRQQFKIDFAGVHGISHWLRVAENGLMLAPEVGGCDRLVVIFAFFHDCRRLNEFTDPDHGRRGGAYFQEAFRDVFNLSQDEEDVLVEACAGHTDEMHHTDPTIACAYDGDRLDLWRVGIVPDPQYFSTAFAKREDMRAWANRYQRSRLNQCPAIAKALLS